MSQDDSLSSKPFVREFLANNWGALYTPNQLGHKRDFSDDEIIEGFVDHRTEDQVRQVIDGIRAFLNDSSEPLAEKARFIHENAYSTSLTPSDDDQAIVDWLERQARKLEAQLHHR